MKRLLSSLSCLVAILICSAAGAADVIKVGAVINLTGPISSWGKYHAKGLQDYIKYVNEVKGGVGGAKIELTIADHGYKTAEGIKLVKKFCEEGVTMIGTWDTGLGIQVKPIIKEYKIPTFNFSTGQDIMNPPIDYMFLTINTYELDTEAVLEYIKTVHKGKGNPKVGLLTLDNAYGKSVHEPAKQYAQKHGIDVVGIEQFPAKTIDLTAELLRLQQAGAEYVFTQLIGANMVSAFEAADRIKYNPQFIGSWTVTDPDFFKSAQGLMRDRLKMQFQGVLPGDSAPGIQLIQDLIKRYRSVDKFDISYWVGITVGMVMERGALRAKEKFGKITPETVSQALETFQGEDFGGVIPKLTYTKTRHEGSFVGRIVQVKEDGTFTPVTNFFTPGKGQLKILK